MVRTTVRKSGNVARAGKAVADRLKALSGRGLQVKHDAEAMVSFEGEASRGALVTAFPKNYGAMIIDLRDGNPEAELVSELRRLAGELSALAGRIERKAGSKRRRGGQVA